MKLDIKKLVILNIPFVVIGLFATKIGQAFRLAEGAELADKLLHIQTGFAAAFQNFMPSFRPMDLLVGITAGLLLKAVVHFKGKNAKKYRKGIEYGSARWGTEKDIKPYIDPKPENNVILTDTEILRICPV